MVSIPEPEAKKLLLCKNNAGPPSVKKRRLISYFFWSSPNTCFNLLSARMKKNLASYDAYDRLNETLNELDEIEGLDSLDKMLYLEKRHFLADHNLTYTDKMSMATGVEVRVPLIDQNILDYASKLPTSYKIRGKEGKWIFKKSMEGLLPQDVIYRPKTGFGAPIRHWLRNDLNPLVEEYFSKEVVMSRDLFDYEEINNLLTADRQNKIDASYTIFQIICIEKWCRLFMDKN